MNSLVLLITSISILLTSQAQYNFPYYCVLANSSSINGSSSCTTGNYLAGSLTAETSYRIAPCCTRNSPVFYFRTNTASGTITCQTEASTISVVCTEETKESANYGPLVQFCNITVPHSIAGIYYKLHQVCL